MNVTVAAAASPHAPVVAPPATPQVAAACQRQVAAAIATADDTTHVPHGPITLSGCVSDSSGIQHVVVRWSQGDEHGRICTDPDVVEGQWTCTWDTTQLPAGKYELELIAVDAAGNQGTSTRKYAIDDRQLVPKRAPAPHVVPPTPPTPPTPTPTPTPTTAPTAPAVTTPPVQTPPITPPAPTVNFSPLQQLVIDRVAACERGGVDELPTDDPAVTDQRDQVQLVLDCLSPALTLAGASSSRVQDQAPLPLTIIVEVESPVARADLDAALPDTIAGVPVLVTIPPPVDEQTPTAPVDAAATPAVPTTTTTPNT